MPEKPLSCQRTYEYYRKGAAMIGRNSQTHSPATATPGTVIEANGCAGDGKKQEAIQQRQQPLTRKIGFSILLAAEALPPGFLEENDDDALTYTDPGDAGVRQSVQELRQAVVRFNVCWCTAPDQLAGDLYRLWVAPSPELLHSTQALPLFFTAEELQAALTMVPEPHRSLRPPSPLVVPTEHPGVGAEQNPSPAFTSAPEPLEVYASLNTIRWAFDSLRQRAEAKTHLPFRLRQLWLLRAALQAILLDQQRLADLADTAHKVRRVLVCRAQIHPDRIKIEPRYEDGQLVGFELVVTVPPALAVA